jgi:hypothetical protein
MNEDEDTKLDGDTMLAVVLVGLSAWAAVWTLIWLIRHL